MRRSPGFIVAGVIVPFFSCNKPIVLERKPAAHPVLAATNPAAESHDTQYREFIKAMSSHTMSVAGDKCPDGHRTLKNVPIIYGLVRAETPDEKEALYRALRNHEFVLGGCCRDSESPSVQPTCMTCGFSYHSQFNLWSRDSDDVKTFRRPFSRLVTTFPKPAKAALQGKIEYDQNVYKDIVIMEGVKYTSTRDRHSIVAEINRWFKQTGSDQPGYTQSDEGSVVDLKHQEISRWNTKDITVELQYVDADHSSRVRLHVNHINSYLNKMYRDHPE